MLSRCCGPRARTVTATLVVTALAVLVIGCTAAFAREPGTSLRAQTPNASAVLLARGAGYDQLAGSDRVRALQSELRRVGHDPGPVDGLFGPRTEAAVRAFQSGRGLAMDGIVGRATGGALGLATSAGQPRGGGGRPSAGESGAGSPGPRRRPREAGNRRGAKETPASPRTEVTADAPDHARSPAAPAAGPRPTRAEQEARSDSRRPSLVAVALVLAGLVALVAALLLRRGRRAMVTRGSIARVGRARLALERHIQAVGSRARTWRPRARRLRTTSPLAGARAAVPLHADRGDGRPDEPWTPPMGREPSEPEVGDAAVASARTHGNGHRAAELEAHLEQVTSRERLVAASRPGEKVGVGCFYLGRLTDGSGAIWQYTAVDLASGYAWAEVRISEREPRASYLRKLVQRVGSELRAAGWRLESLTSDDAAKFAVDELRDEVERSGARCGEIHAGQPSLNDHLKRLQQTLLEECWRPASARSGPITLSALQRDLDDFLKTYNRRRTETDGRIRAPRVLGMPRVRASNGLPAVARANGGTPKLHGEHNPSGSGGTVGYQWSTRP